MAAFAVRGVYTADGQRIAARPGGRRQIIGGRIEATAIAAILPG
jgi:hypothetical protein